MSNETLVVSQAEKPFWIRPPLTVLFDLIRLQRVRPWDVNLSYLLTILLGEMKKGGYIDFTTAGIALLSSATIYRMQSELILELQEPPTPPSEKLVEYLPPPIQPPLRYEHLSTTIDHLLQALEEALKNESAVELHPKIIPIMPTQPIIQEIDEFMIAIEKNIENLYKSILRFGDKVIPFSKLTVGLKRLEVIRVFLLVLYLTCRNKIQLWQEEDFGEIYLSIKKCDLNDNETSV